METFCYSCKSLVIMAYGDLNNTDYKCIKSLKKREGIKNKTNRY